MTTTTLAAHRRGAAAGLPGRAPSTAPLRVAVIDADHVFLDGLARRLRTLGWHHRVSAVALSVERLVALRIDAVVLDLALLGPGAWDYLASVTGALPELPVLVCAGPSTVADRVRGLRLGADDWLAKPCHPEELIARLESAVRGRRHAAAPREREALTGGDLTIVPDQFQAFVGAAPVELTRREFELIHVLADAAGRVLPREEIYQRVWGYAMPRGDRSVDVFVRKLRQKLERASPAWSYIHTHFGIGYRFDPRPVG